MTDMIVKIMIEVISVLALATQQIKQGRFSKASHYFSNPITERATEKFAKKLLGECEIEAVLQRLDRLTKDEAQMTATQTLEVVHGLVNNVKVVMDGTQALLISRRRLNRLIRVDGKASIDGIRQALGMFSLYGMLVFLMLTGGASCNTRGGK